MGGRGDSVHMHWGEGLECIVETAANGLNCFDGHIVHSTQTNSVCSVAVKKNQNSFNKTVLAK